LVEISSSGLKLKENEIFLLQWIEVGVGVVYWYLPPKRTGAKARFVSVINIG